MRMHGYTGTCLHARMRTHAHSVSVVCRRYNLYVLVVDSLSAYEAIMWVELDFQKVQEKVRPSLCRP